LWLRVIEAGAILSETAPGRQAQAWRFPARNRIIAGLVRMVVVVESHAAGGSLITAEAAIARGIDVRVVPGPVHSSASAGSNQLLYDGPGPVRDARDVLDGLGIFRSGSGRSGSGRSGSGRSGSGQPAAASRPADPAPSLDARRILEAVSWQYTSLTQVVERSRLSVGAASRALDELETVHLVGRHGDWWVRRRGPGEPQTPGCAEPDSGEGRRSG
jgi:DNA processing protein